MVLSFLILKRRKKSRVIDASSCWKLYFEWKIVVTPPFIIRGYIEIIVICLWHVGTWMRLHSTNKRQQYSMAQWTRASIIPIIIDQGSQSTFITENVAQLLQIPRKKNLGNNSKHRGDQKKNSQKYHINSTIFANAIKLRTYTLRPYLKAAKHENAPIAQNTVMGWIISITFI